MDHNLETIDLGNDAKHHRRLCARCTCGFLTPVVNSIKDNDDEMSRHQRDARRMRLGLGISRPNLKTTLKHYEVMAAHPACTVTERSQWVRLAEEVRLRIEQTTVDNTLGQDSLLDLVEE